MTEQFNLTHFKLRLKLKDCNLKSSIYIKVKWEIRIWVL